ncbi:DUF5794 domain-containing protein [Halorubellus litoreus]|uniref:DUF5794 domain-containing protein n=1 Tax=Halorubellus litoreus TaxID=755308 RepID=A0ABD5VD99_9EURY
MSTSRHPIALKLEGLVGGDAKLLATVMALPLLDGIFPALVLAGALEESTSPLPVVGALPIGIVQVGLLVFGGSATVAVVLAEMSGTRMERVRTILAVGALITVGAAVEAAIAPTLASVLTLHLFERFAALVIIAIAAKTASARIGEYLPRPAVIVGAGLIASIDLSNPTIEPTANPELVALAAGSALVGTAFALATALLAPHLRARMAIDRFRFGSAVALGLLALSILKLPVGSAPLLVVAVTALFAFEPDATTHVTADDADDADDATAADDANPTHPGTVPATDGGDDTEPVATFDDTDPTDDATDHTGDDGSDSTNTDDGDDAFQVDREPWL